MNDSEGHDDGGSASDDADEDRVQSGAGEPRQDEQHPIDDDEIENIGDLGNEFDDPEGWMSERPDYWTDLGDAPWPSRASFLRHRIAELIGLLKALSPHPTPAWPSERVAEAVWRGAVEDAFGAASFPAILVNPRSNEMAMTPPVEPSTTPPAEPSPRGTAIKAIDPSVGALSEMTVAPASAGMTEFPHP